jgi:hypothetical protein
MDKLNLTKEQVEQNYTTSIAYGLHSEELRKDWLVMYAEIERLNKLLLEVVFPDLKEG